MNCLVCRGACCEEFALPVTDLIPPTDDASRWLALHGVVDRGYLRFECRCTKLGRDGRCTIYDSRPQVCRDYHPGSEDCYDAVRRRRTPLQYVWIRDPGDPERIHG